MNQTRHQRGFHLFHCGVLLFVMVISAHAQAPPQPQQGFASWYGEEHRGKLMANGHKFDPDKMTAASWFYPLGTRVRVTVSSPDFEARTVTVTITDRGPAKRLVDQGRVIDLAHGAFQRLAHPHLGLVTVVVEPLRKGL